MKQFCTIGELNSNADIWCQQLELFEISATCCIFWATVVHNQAHKLMPLWQDKSLCFQQAPLTFEIENIKKNLKPF